MKRFAVMLIGILAVLCLSGCSFTGSGVENLLVAPKFTEEQSEIYSALIKYTGENIVLKYPKNGDNRSAIIMENLDDDDADEAIVLYQMKTASNDSVVRVTMLDSVESGAWEARLDLSGGGTDVDEVVVAENQSNEKFVIIGYTSLSLEEKVFHVYLAKNSLLTLTLQDYYSVMNVFDIDNNGYKELITIKNDSATSSPQAYLYRFTDKSIISSVSAPMVIGTVGYTACTIGMLDEETPAMFVETVTSGGVQGTEIIYFYRGALVNPMADIGNGLFSQTLRTVGYNSVDLDGDGVLEIPKTTVMRGYENVNRDKQLLFTEWYDYDTEQGFAKSFSGYYSSKGSYAFVFPTRWGEQVTAQYDTATDELIIYRYDGELSDDMTELMRIIFVGKTETEKYTHIGYQKIGENGQIDYLLKLESNRREPLIPTVDEVENNFYVL